MSTNGLQTSSVNRLSALKSKHHTLETKIHNEEKRPLPSDFLLKRLKLEKLHIKEELDKISVVS